MWHHAPSAVPGQGTPVSLGLTLVQGVLNIGRCAQGLPGYTTSAEVSMCLLTSGPADLLASLMKAGSVGRIPSVYSREHVLSKRGALIARGLWPQLPLMRCEEAYVTSEHARRYVTQLADRCLRLLLGAF